jgi:hypothetical protein
MSASFKVYGPFEIENKDRIGVSASNHLETQ